MYVVPLHTARLALRRLREDDAADFFAVFSHPEVTRYWSSAPLADPAEAAARVGSILRHYAEGDLFQLAVTRRGEDRLIGTCTLHQIHRQNRRAELGYALARECWGQGLMHEALVAFIDHAFAVEGLHRLEADIDPRNAASARSLERLGFVREGHLRERWIVEGEVSDSALYGLLAREWQARKAA